MAESADYAGAVSDAKLHRVQKWSRSDNNGSSEGRIKSKEPSSERQELLMSIVQPPFDGAKSSLDA